MTATIATSCFDATERLAQRVLGGQVVFFIGAGFSLDSEHNTVDRLVARLLARVLALGSTLAGESGSANGPARDLIEKGLGRVFSLKEAERGATEALQPEQCMTEANVRQLAREYYNFNEWSVSALGVLAGEIFTLEASRRSTVTTGAHELENSLLARLGGDRVPLEAIDWGKLEHLFERNADLGKALLLDTMGFANEEIMAGKPRLVDATAVAESYHGRLRPRHHALARLAREGLLPALVTTNYDLLLEGAYRLAGFVERVPWPPALDAPPPTAVPRFSRIAGADQFFARGESHRTALLLKIHGCAESYRDARSEKEPGSWARYLPALVFTYREIQTWRNDAWSRDLIRTLLRTHTLVLAGYSGADPVMHSTFREVYEEMAQLRSGHGSRTEPSSATDAPIFFFDVAGKREFYSLEILRAATRASCNDDGEAVGHPNQIEFQVATRERPELRDHFPNLDDHMRWLLHSALRELQARALQTHLCRLAPRLLGHPCPEREHEQMCKAFEQLRKEERERVACSQAARGDRRLFDDTVGWTWHFLPRLLREFALAELMENNQGPGRSVEALARAPWYFPASEHLEWTAWAAVVELAVRRMVAAWGKSNSLAPEIAAEDGPHAAISFSGGKQQRQPYALCIRAAALERAGRAPVLEGAFRRVTAWELSGQDMPWRARRAGRCPSAARLWEYALGSRPWHAHDAFCLGALHE